MSSFNADVTKAYYDYVVVGYKTCYDITDGCSYFYDIILTTDKDKNIKQVRFLITFNFKDLIAKSYLPAKISLTMQ